MYEKEYKSLTLRLGFALLLMLVLLQGLMTVLAFAQMLFQAVFIEKAADILYWSLYNLIYLASFMLPVPFFMLISGKKKREPIHFEVRFPPRFALMVCACVGMILAAGQVNSLLLAPFSGESASTDMILDMVGADKGYMVVLVFVMIVIVPAFCEEFLFRGLVLGNLLPYGKSVAIVGSALMFAAMHQNFGQFLYTAVAGIVMGFLYVRSRSIWPSTLVHMLNNLLSFVQVILFARIEDEMMAGRVTLCINLAVIAAGIVCLVMLLYCEKSEKEAAPAQDGLFGHNALQGGIDGAQSRENELPQSTAMRKLFSPSIIAFLALSFLLALLNLMMENLV